MSTAIVTKSDLLLLRRTVPEDLDFVLSAEHHEENHPFIIAWPRAQHQKALANSDMAHLICETVESAKTVGYIILAGLQNSNHSVEFRRLVITDKGCGFGRAAVKLVKKLAFEKMQAHRLWLDVKTQNCRARRLYESEGFVVEGILRECLKSEAGFDSLVVMSMLRNEYRNADGRLHNLKEYFPMQKVNLREKFNLFTEYWRPKIAGELNGQYVKLVKLKGEFIWHQHEAEDELFLVVKGQLCLQLRDREVWLDEGEFFIVPKGVEHKPVAENEVHVLLFEPMSTLNTGDKRNERAVEKLERI